MRKSGVTGLRGIPHTRFESANNQRLFVTLRITDCAKIQNNNNTFYLSRNNNTH